MEASGQVVVVIPRTMGRMPWVGSGWRRRSPLGTVLGAGDETCCVERRVQRDGSLVVKNLKPG